MILANSNAELAAIIAFLGAYLVIAVVILLGCYVVTSIAHMKALKALGYDKPWMAWIPFANYYAYADSVTNGQDTVTLFGNLSVPVMVYKFWWIAIFVAPLIPVIGSLLLTVIIVVFLGNCYTKMYARLENTPEQDQQVIGYLSGFFAIIAVVKFLIGKYDTKTIY